VFSRLSQFSPESLPSPPEEWQVFSVRQWLLDVFGWDIGLNFGIHAYAICLMLGMIAAGYIAHRRLTRRGGEPGVVLDIAIWAVLFGIAGARAWHVLTHPDDYFNGQPWWSVFAIWEGGIAIFGSLVGGAIGAWIGCRLTGVRFWSFADALAPGMLVAQAIGRLGNWFNHELFGMPTDLPWGLEIESDNPAFPAGLPDGTLFHPTFLYEMIWNLIGAVVILVVARELTLGRRTFFDRVTVPFPVGGRHPFQWGRVFGLYLVWYGIGRIFFESIRVDPSELFLGVRSNVWGAVLAVILGIAIVVVQGRRHPGREPSVYVPGREWVDPSAIESEETYSDDDSDDATPSAVPATTVPATSGAKARS
jgi:prolipoprotein diacylglyceryl transferase